MTLCQIYLMSQAPTDTLRETGRYPRLITAPIDEVIIQRRGIYRLSRRGLLEQVILRDGLSCGACGRKFSSKYDKELTMDHKIPISQGGKPTAIANLQLLCKQC